tara:strand:- start:129 stop:395 length:267 start_codon:yes stop_codon:yes gene_type:complete
MKFKDVINESSWEKMHNYLTGRFEDEFGLVDINDLVSAVKKSTDRVTLKCASPQGVKATYNALKSEFDEFDIVTDKHKLIVVISYKKD